MIDLRNSSITSISTWNLFACAGIAGLTALAFARSLASRKVNKQIEETLISEKKCRTPQTRLAYKWPLALDLLLEAARADKAGGILNFFLVLMERYGNTFEQILLGARGIDTQDPRNIEAVLSTQFNEFCLGARSENYRPLLGHGIFTQDGAAWKNSRDLLRPQFMHTRTKSFPAIQEQIEKLVQAIKIDRRGNVDLQPLFFRLTLDTTMAVLFGKPLDSLQAQGAGDEEAFARAFDYAQHMLAVRGRLGDFFWLLSGREFRRSCKMVHDFVDEIVAHALEEEEKKLAIEDPDRYIFLQALISKTKDRLVLRDYLINILLAGRDTTACLLSWTFKFLAEHQDVQEKLRHECRELPSFKLGELPTPAEIKAMKYIHNVLSEVLRLYPSVPVNSRSAVKTTTLPFGGGSDGKSPIIVKKGEAVGYCVYTMHRRKDIYGEDAAEFRPSRWDEDGLKNLGWAYLPFNGGPRICPGQEFALLEAAYTVIRLLQTFKHVRRPADEPSKHSHTLTLVVASANGCKVDLER